MKELLEQGYGNMIIGAVTGAGVLCKWCLFFYYAGIGQACKKFTDTKNKTIVFIRNDLEKRKNANQGIKSAMIYTECRLAERKVLGIRLGGLETLAEQSLLLVLLSGVLVAFSGVLSGCENETVFRPLFYSSVFVFLMMIADLITGLKEKRRRVRLCIRDYIENRWAPDQECAEWSEEFSAKEIRRQKRAERREEKKQKETARREEREKKKADKVKPVKVKRVSGKSLNGKKNGKAQEEKRRLTEELLRERRQLEARHFAQQRKVCAESAENVTMVQEEVNSFVRSGVPEDSVVRSQPVMREEKEQEPVREEAAATTENAGMTYEMLLSEVIAEYLA